MKTIVSKNMLLRYSPKNHIPPVAARYLAAPLHPIYPKISHMWAQRDRSILWWRVNTQQLRPFKRVVRSWCARRARIAFQEALHTRGLDKLGRPISSEASNQTQGLKGSLEVILRPETRDLSFESLQQDALGHLDSVLQKNADTRNAPSSRKGSQSAKRTP